MSSKKRKQAPFSGPSEALGRTPGPQLLLALGTYDGGLVGYRLSVPSDAPEAEAKIDKPKAELVRVFAVNAHSGCVKALCAPGKLLVSGSTDECIRIFDLGCMQERGSLLAGRGGSISAIASAGARLCLSLDGERKVSVWRISDWSLLKTIQIAGDGKGTKAPKIAPQHHYGHKLSVHPSCKLALCLNGSSALHLIDLLKGHCAATFVLEEPTTDVCWSSDGNLFCTLADKTAKVIRTGGGGCSATLRVSEPAVSWSVICFGGVETLYLGTSAGEIHCFLLSREVADDTQGAPSGAPKRDPMEKGLQQPEGPLRLAVLKGLHQTRIKSIVSIRSQVLEGQAKELIASCDSSGLLVIWMAETNGDKTKMTFEPIASTDTHCRLTCLVASTHWGSKMERPSAPVSSSSSDAAACDGETEAENRAAALNTKKTKQIRQEKNREGHPAKKVASQGAEKTLKGKRRDRKRQRHS